MSYRHIAAMTQSTSLRDRLSAAAAQEGASGGYENWVAVNIWDIVKAPGWAEAWSSALSAGISDPGRVESVITDGMILAVVQPLINPAPPAE